MSNTEPMTAAGFASKVEWEGGIFDALEYGLKPEDAPEGDLRDAWGRLYAAWEQMQPHLNEVSALLDAIEPASDED